MQDEEAAVIALVERVFDETVAPHYSDAGVQEFYAYAAPEALTTRSQSGHFVLVAEHVSLLFVERRGRGIGRRLLRAALAVSVAENPDLSRVTVHSSPNAVRHTSASDSRRPIRNAS